ncbi:MAG: hypothetical protein ABIA93_07710 [Candidatus Woesearchaeota archaeon]
MATVTLAIPDDIRTTMAKYDEVNWSGFIRKCIVQKTNDLAWRDSILKKADEEQEITSWASDLVRKGRRGSRKKA